MHRVYRGLVCGLTGLLLTTCTSPTTSTPVYPQNPAISDALGHPRDSATFYFPMADSSYIPTDPIDAQTESYPPRRLRFSSCNLLHFGAPALSNYYTGQDIYRFLWLRSFHRPVLLTLTRLAHGATLRTQLLSKPACGPKMTQIQFFPPNATVAQRKRLREAFNRHLADPAVQQEMAEANKPATQVVAEETVRAISLQQWQQFEHLLPSDFQQLPAYQASSSRMDGAYWLLEAHQASGYHMVFRHSPDETDAFRKACGYLLDLSSAREEERY
jgi:hypothetical protein